MPFHEMPVLVYIKIEVEQQNRWQAQAIRPPPWCDRVSSGEMMTGEMRGWKGTVRHDAIR